MGKFAYKIICYVFNLISLEEFKIKQVVGGWYIFALYYIKKASLNLDIYYKQIIHSFEIKNNYIYDRFRKHGCFEGLLMTLGIVPLTSYFCLQMEKFNNLIFIFILSGNMRKEGHSWYD